MTISANYPSIRPSLLLDFANTKQLDPRITFTRASTATAYDGKTTVKAEENLLTYSQDFTNSFWLKSSCSITANSTTAPDGNSTGTLLTCAAGTTGYHTLQDASTLLGAAGTQTFSVYIKAGTWNYYSLYCYTGSSTWVIATVDLSSGTITKTGSSGGQTYVSSSVVSVGNSWYRVSLTGTYTAAIVPGVYIEGSNTPAYSGGWGSTSWTAAGTETAYIWGAQLEQRSTVTAYTPTTTQPITNYIPALQTAAAGVPRFEHDPVTGESKGFLTEEQRTNLLTYSEQFDNAVWTKGGATITANTVVAPDGTLTGDKLVEDGTNNEHFVRYSGAAPLGASTFSLYAKASGRSELRVAGSNSPGNGGGDVSFNLATGSVVSNSNSGVLFPSIVSVGNGWYRCTVVFSNTLVGAQTVFVYASYGGTINYTGDGYSGIYIWGAQLEAGSFATSYIPTVSSQVTRSADAASMTGANFSSWFSNAEGTLYLEGMRTSTAAINEVMLSLDSSDASNTRMSLYCAQTNNQSGIFIPIVGVTQANITGSNFTNNVNYKVSVGYKVNDFAFVKDGAAVATDTSGNVPSVGLLSIGKTNSQSSQHNGTIKRIAYYPKRLSDANLVAITS